MKIKAVCILCLFILSAGIVEAQEFKKKYMPLAAAKDTAGMRVLLKQWWDSDPNDPEVFMAYFNYHVLKSKKEVAGGATEYNPAEVKKAMGYIDKGITAFPNRLDMRFGKISLLGDLKNYKGFTEEIIKTIDKAQKNKNAWLWTNNVPQAAPGDFMLTNISEFVRLLIQVGSGEPIDNATDISELVLKNYPNHPESLVNLASCYLLKKQDNKAVSLLLKAEQINYEDISALTKLASIYKTRGDKQKALEYYDKIIRFGDKAEKEEARKEVELLKQK